MKLFCGHAKDWEEFSEKIKSQVAARDMLAASVLNVVETMVRETDVEEDDQCPYVAESDARGEDQIIKLSTAGTRRERKVQCEPLPGLEGWSLETTHRQKNIFMALTAEREGQRGDPRVPDGDQGHGLG